jgi:cell division septum initiation protein DivIVA
MAGERTMDLKEVAGKDFLVGLRGYVKEDVRVYLRAVSDELFRREDVITDLRRRLDEANRELADARQRFEETNGRFELDRATLVKMVGEEASAILSTADGAAERIRLEADRYAESVRDGFISTRSHLTQLHHSVGQLLDEIYTMERERAGPPISFQPDVALLGPDDDGSLATGKIRLEDELPASGADGESDWPWVR